MAPKRTTVDKRTTRASRESPAPAGEHARPARWAALPLALSASRLGFAAAFPFAGRTGGIALAVAAALSDGLDGFLARRWRVTTVLGSLLDALADKAFIWSALGTFVLRGDLSPWVFALLLVRDVITVPAAIVIAFTKSWDVLEQLDHLTTSRLATLMLFTLVITKLALPAALTLNHIVAGLAAGLSVFAGAAYLARVRRQTGATVRREPQLEHERR